MQEALTIPERDTEHERVLGIVFELSPGQASVLSCLARAPIATADQLLEFSGLKPPMKVIIFHTRKKLRTHGIDINSKVNVGYWIDAKDKLAIENEVSKFVYGVDLMKA